MGGGGGEDEHNKDQENEPYYSPEPLNTNQFDDFETPPSENEPEPEPENKKRKSKGKKVVAESSEKPKSQRMPRMPWTTEEEVILVQQWINATQNVTLGKSQAGESFWRTVRNNYNRLADRKRNGDQISGKWSKLQKEIKIFSTIYNKYKKSRQSGANDVDIMEAARSRYRDQTKKVFAYEATWRIVKDYPKFYASEGVTGPTRHQQLDDNPINLGANDDEQLNINLNPNPNLEQIFTDDLIRRPPCRTVSRKSQKSSGSSDATSSRCSADEVRYQIFKTSQSQQDALDAIKEATRMKQMCRAFEVLNTPVNPLLPPGEQQMLQDFRQRLKNTYLRNRIQQKEEDSDSN